jgi:hypothetical protein
MDTDRIIREMLGVKAGDSLPYKGWKHTSTRADLLKIFSALGYTQGVEVGVSEGRFSEEMLRSIPGLQLLSVDPWQAYGRISQRLCDERHEHAVSRLVQYPGATILRAASLEASRAIADGSLDFCYVDADHTFDACMLDIILWASKVRKGGIVSGHDFYTFYQSGVMDAVYAYTRAHNIGAWYVTWEKEASWFWVQR